MPKTYYTNARMPIYSSIAANTEVADLKEDESNAYLYDNLDPECMNAPYGYRTVSPDAENSNFSWFVLYNGTVYNDIVDGVDSFGARPVINLKI